MLNYIWAGLIVFSLAFALVTDVSELVHDRFPNDAPVPASVTFPEGYDTDARRQPVRVSFDSDMYRDRFADDAPDSLAAAYDGTLVQTRDGRQIRLDAGSLPEPLATIRSSQADDDGDPLRATLQGDTQLGVGPVAVDLRFEPVRFRKMNDIAQAALNFAETAASLALGFIGILGLMLGLVKIGEEAGLVQALARFVQPVLSPLFPSVPKDHPALANVTLNLLANVFGLGNAATPLGIKAMEDLQELNPKKDTATDDMVMLLALNTSSVQLVPPSLLVAIMGLQINQLFFSITLATLFSTIAGILGAYGLSRLRRFRESNPMLQSDEA
ncbi:nucleoside recognition protein [Longibacter salinarum]|uniref:Nucleoside recognition protein n=1 Tax=Longibacter salinarum TaxID=1850348 RepID=A0A2A8D1B2_9BACT|nr:nucleoside recognition domain-containing protein [Longibacter salinarum]PEN14752.1 nucleoside recognition protein [Longibacter salinarum]